jgi:hypothetical protein
VASIQRGREYYDSLLELLRSPVVAHVTVLDGMGRRWYAGVAFKGGEYNLGEGRYMATVEITEVADVPVPVVTATPPS